jgi:DNA-binding GntR family transcriptional regulator
LRARIDSGEIPVGGMLPSVSQIQGEYGVAKITAQKALHVLVDEGLARVVKGWAPSEPTRPARYIPDH